MQDQIRCAVIGAGWWGTTAHLPALQRHPHAKVVAIQHCDSAQAAKIARDFDVPHACTTLEQVLAIEPLDAVVISSIPSAHYSQVKAALERGLHVLVEKPMTRTVDEARELQALAESRGLQLLLSCPWHYTSHGIKARELIRSGALGELKLISILMTNFTLGLYQGLPWGDVFERNPTLQNAATPYLAPGQSSYSDPEIACGGQIYCQVSHAAAHLAFLTGQHPKSVFARFDNAGTSVDVHNALNIQLEQGTLVSLTSSGATMLSERNYEVRIYGTRGMLLMELWKGLMAFHDLDCHVQNFEPLAVEEIYPMEAPVTNLIDILAKGSLNGSPGEYGVCSMEVIDAARESASSGRDVLVQRGHVHAGAK